MTDFKEHERQSVLVVDDERINRTVLADLLKAEYQVLLAKSGEQALERALQDNAVDLILLDVMMPEMDGYEVIRQLKQHDKTRDIPVIFITALNSVGDEEMGLSLGASDYIGKPFSPAIVRARVGNLMRFVHQRKLLEALAGRDGLTEIPNRRTFDETLVRELRRNAREGGNLSLAMIDVDYFKQYNDHYGHARGDWVLKSVARALSRVLSRPSDFVARYGGEEFVLIMPDTDAKGARAVAELARTAVEALAIAHEKSNVAPYITVSVGGSTVTAKNLSELELAQQADARLYDAKHHGRNRVVWHPT
ncbi:MAG: diguanylate cyclase [Rhodoferax sp.]|nr:diguanylate cyclase [Rhodoferax sp.]